MNEIVAAMILAVVQGITEWLPVSSSAHLVIVSHLIGFDTTLLFTLALHFGTLMAVFVYFGKDITDILRDLLSGKFKTSSGKLGVSLIIAAIPIGIAGFFLHDIINATFANLPLLMFGLFITSLILLIGSFDFRRRVSRITPLYALLIGLAQIASLFRGISRSGSTIAAGLLLGLSEKEVVKFSFLLSIPVVLSATLYELGNQTLPPSYLWASLVSFLVGLLAIHISFKYILASRKNLRWIALYVFVVALSLCAYLLL